MSNLSIDEGLFINVNGVNQWITLRGNDSRNPVLLVISGPGVALSAIAPFYEAWEESFTLVHWDQPGAGATHAVNPEGQESLGIDRLVSDGIVVTETVRQRLGVDRIAVLGVSAGSIVGLKMMQTRPQYYSAYIGTGQFVNWAEQDLQGYNRLLAKARDRGDKAAQQVLADLGPPPYADAEMDVIKSQYHSALTEAEMAVFPEFAALTREALTSPPPAARYIPQGVALENPRELATAAYRIMRHELLAFDAYTMPLEFAMPVFFIQGDADYYSVTGSVQAYEEAITAPVKGTIVIEGGSHSVIWLREQFLEALQRHVLPEIARQGD